MPGILFFFVGSFDDDLLNKSIPAVTGRTLAQPFGAFISTALAKKGGFGLAHAINVNWKKKNEKSITSAVKEKIPGI